MKNFNFLLDPPEDIVIPSKEHIGPNLNNIGQMTPKKFAASVLEVYSQLGGASWLLMEAKANPRAFLELLKKLIPSGIQMEDLHGFSIRLIDQFGNQIEFETQTSPLVRDGGVPAIAPPTATSGDPSHESGQLDEIATGGNPNNAVGVVSDIDINIQDTFDD